MSKKKKRHISATIYTGGEPTPGLPFQGEAMTCVMCGRTQVSDPAVESNWRAITVDGEAYYACTREFPHDGARAGKFAKAYARILSKIAALKGGTVN